MSKSKIKILFVAPFQLSIRNLIYSGLAAECVNKLTATVSFASPYQVAEFKDDFGNIFKNYTVTSQIERGGLQSPVGTSFFLKVICAIRMRIFAIEMPSGSYLMHTLSACPKMSDAVNPRSLVWAIAKLITLVFRKHGIIRSQVALLLNRYMPVHPEERAIINAQSPDLVVLTSHCTYWSDIRFQIEAKRVGIPVVSFVFSWDNLFSRGPMMRPPDWLLVWSDLMQGHAVEYHNYPKNHVEVVGALQFSQYETDISSKDIYENLAPLGVRANEEYFLYVPGAMTWEYDAEDFRALYSILSGSKYKNVRIVFRPHPQSPKGAYKSLSDLPIVFDSSPNITENSASAMSFNAAEMRHMGCLIKGAKAVISSWGTTALLEAAIFDRPTLQLRWMDSIRHYNQDQLDRVVMFQRYRHLKDFDQERPRHFCDSPKTLIADLDYVFANDASFRENRRKTVAQLVRLPLQDSVSRTVEVFKRILTL